MNVSIAICTYNGERFLQRQLESFACQTRLPNEVIVCDDGSTDATVAIVKRWAESVPFPVRVTVNPQNLGFVKNFEQAISFCSGDIIFLSDQDDVWYPDKMERMARLFDQNPETGLVYGNARIVDSRENDLGMDAAEYSRTGCDYREPGYFLPPEDRTVPLYAGCLCAIRKSLANRLLPIPEQWPHDLWLFLAGRQFTRTETILDPLMAHRRHGANTTTAANNGRTGTGQISAGSTANPTAGESLPEVDPLADYYRFVDSAKRYYYRESPYLFDHYKERRERWLEFLLSLPDCPQKARQLNFFRDQIRHFTRRIQGGASIANWRCLAAELVNGGYFRRPEPILSFLYDVYQSFRRTREFLTNRLTRNESTRNESTRNDSTGNDSTGNESTGNESTGIKSTRNERISVVTAVTDETMYRRFFRNNRFLRSSTANSDTVELCPLDNQIENRPVSERYNEFLDRYDYSQPGWLVFCHQDWFVRENLASLLGTLDKSTLWGPIGSRLIKTPEGELVCEHRGQIRERRRNGKAGRILSGMTDWRLLPTPQVDTLDCLALFVHSDLVNQYNLRFDPRFQFDLYVEDFCLNAQRKAKIVSRVVKMRAEHWSDAGYRDRQNSGYWEQRQLFNQKYPDGLWAGTCSVLGGNNGQTIDACPVRCRIR